MFNLDLKKVETALKAGRLDEAFDMLTSTPRRSHADGQRLVDRLLMALLQRGHQHCDQERFDAARADAALAQKLGGRQIEIVELIQHIDRLDHSMVIQSMQRNQQEMLERLKQLVEAEYFEQAAALMTNLPQSQRQSPELQQLAKVVGDSIRAEIQCDLAAGRLDRASAGLLMLKQAAIGSNATRQLETQLKRFHKVIAVVRQADYARALRLLKLQQRVFPEADWIAQALAAMESCVCAVEQIFSGPLGFVDGAVGPKTLDNLPFHADDAVATADLPHSDFLHSDPRNRAALLHVDQLGSLMVLTESRITIGTTSSVREGRRPDIALQTEGGAVVSILRSGEDYLATSEQPFTVNDRSARQHLLGHSDTIQIGKRGRMKFLRSVTASDSAVLKITGSKMKQRQIRSVVLMGDSLVFGQNSGHFRLSGLKKRVLMRPVPHGAEHSGFLIHQQGNTDRKTLQPGTTASFDGCQFSLEQPGARYINLGSIS